MRASTPTPEAPLAAADLPSARALLGAAVLLSVGAIAGVVLLGVPFDTVQGSTEAWLMAHVQRLHWLGDPAVAAHAGGLPNLVSNPLYPTLVWSLSGGTAGALWVGHAVAAGALGITALALWGLWRRALGTWGAVAAAGAVLLPSMVSTAAQARYDSLAFALCLLATWAAQEGSRGHRRAWIGTGLALGAALLCREYIGVIALLAVLTLGVSGRAWRGLVLALALAILVTVSTSLVLELSPLAGAEAIWRYRSAASADRPVFSELLGPLPQRVALAAGALGWGMATWRSPDRRGLLAPLALLAPFVLLVAYPQQSAQYYLLAQVLLLSGIGGFVLLLPAHTHRLVPLSSLALAAWSTQVVPHLLFEGSASRTSLHSETWSDDRAHLATLVDEVVAAAGSGPLVLSSQRVENLDAYAELRHQRPIAFVFPNELDRARDFVPAFGGADVRLVVVDHREQPVEMDVSGMVAQTTHGALRARTWVLPGATSSEDPCTWDYTPRGFCLQRDWLSGGLPQMQAGAATRRARRPGLLRY